MSTVEVLSAGNAVAPPGMTPLTESEIRPEDMVEFPVDDLIIGRPLRTSIVDEQGMLLLAAGQVLTTSARQNMRNLGLSQVKIHRTDADSLSLQKIELRTAATLVAQSELAAKLDAVVEKGLFQVSNSGPAVRERRKQHGANAYDDGRKAQVAELQKQTHSELSSLVREAIQGRSDSGEAVTQIAAKFLAATSDDTDCLLSVAFASQQNPDLAQHSLKMSVLAMTIGVEMGFDAENCTRLCVAGLVCDWGMYKLPRELLNANRVLTRAEHLEVQKHVLYTAEILDRTTGLPTHAAVISYQTHERPNGRGYPKQRTTERIHLCAKILAAADTYAALTTPRSWRPALSPYAAMEVMVRMARTRDVDPDVVRALLRVNSLFPIGSLVGLTDGSVAQVIRRTEDYCRPVVEVVQTAGGEMLRATSNRPVIDLMTSELHVAQAMPTPGTEETGKFESYVSLERAI